MHFDGIYRAGGAFLFLAAVAAGRGKLALAVAFLAGCLLLRRCLGAWVRDPGGRRRAFVAFLCAETAVECAVAWSFPVLGAALVVGGEAANLLAVAGNGGRMPYDGDVGNPCYVTIGPGTRFPWLGDMLHATPTRTGRYVYSIGDALQVVGIWVLAAQVLLAKLV